MRNFFGWTAIVGTLAVWFFHPGYRSYGADFFLYRSMAQVARDSGGAAAVYTDSPALTRAMVSSARTPVGDPQFYPEWLYIVDHAGYEPSKPTPATFGLTKLLGLDLLEWRIAFRIWNVISIVALLLAITLIHKFTRLTLPLPWTIVVALWFDPCRSAFIYGNFVELCLLGAAAFFFFLERRPMLAGACLAASILLKPLAAGLVVYLVWNRNWKALGGFIVGAIPILLIFEGWMTWLALFPKFYASYDFHLASYANRSPAAIVGSEWGYLWIGIYALLFLTPTGRRRIEPNAPILALLGVFMVSRFVVIYYEIFLLIPFAVLLARGRRAPLLPLWFGFGFYESFPFLLSARLEIALYPVLIFLLLSPNRDTAEVCRGGA